MKIITGMNTIKFRETTLKQVTLGDGVAFVVIQDKSVTFHRSLAEALEWIKEHVPMCHSDIIELIAKLD